MCCSCAAHVLLMLCCSCTAHVLLMCWSCAAHAVLCAGHVLVLCWSMCWSCAGHVLVMCWSCAAHTVVLLMLCCSCCVAHAVLLMCCSCCAAHAVRLMCCSCAALAAHASCSLLKPQQAAAFSHCQQERGLLLLAYRGWQVAAGGKHDLVESASRKWQC